MARNPFGQWTVAIAPTPAALAPRPEPIVPTSALLALSGEMLRPASIETSSAGAVLETASVTVSTSSGGSKASSTSGGAHSAGRGANLSVPQPDRAEPASLGVKDGEPLAGASEVVPSDPLLALLPSGAPRLPGAGAGPEDSRATEATQELFISEAAQASPDGTPARGDAILPPRELTGPTVVGTIQNRRDLPGNAPDVHAGEGADAPTRFIVGLDVLPFPAGNGELGMAKEDRKTEEAASSFSIPHSPFPIEGKSAVWHDLEGNLTGCVKGLLQVDSWSLETVSRLLGGATLLFALRPHRPTTHPTSPSTSERGTQHAEHQ